jgi:hypothetical protein
LSKDLLGKCQFLTSKYTFVNEYDRTYPTTYVEFDFISGGLSSSATGSTCAFTVTDLLLPTASASQLVFPVTASMGSERVIPFPKGFLDYLNGIPAVSSQFHGKDVGKCSLSSARIEFVSLSTSVGTGTKIAPTMKISVAAL